MTGHYTLRYHLARGRNYKKWQLKKMSPVGKFAMATEYHRPDGFVALLHNCRLRNHGAVAKRIHDGMNKTVCAWVEFDDYHLVRGEHLPRILMGQTDKRYMYNPRKHPHWVSGVSDNEDNAVVPLMLVHNRNLYGIAE
jgi:hypothetical protein